MKKKFVYIFLFLINYCVEGQNIGTRVDKLIKVIPPSPEASSLGQFGNIPVGLFSGVPQISIPLHSLKEGDLEIPVSLTYYSRGTKVSEIASSVGLGWSLNAGGLITRIVRGNPDEANTGYFYRDQRIAPLTLPIPNNLTSAQYTSLENLAYNYTDLDPDLFSFNFLGRTGSFFFDHLKNIHLVTPEDIKIEVTADLGTWTIMDENGNKYIFSTKEETTSTTNQDTQPEIFVSTWYLTKVITLKQSPINFYYKSTGSILQEEVLLETDKYSDVAPYTGNTCYICNLYNGQIQRVTSKQEINSVKLERIETSSAIIFFDRNTQQRDDLYSDYALADVRVFSRGTNIFIKKYHFNYSYFEVEASGYNPGGNKNKRLKLLNIADVTDENNVQFHNFYYDETLLPARDSYAQDYWGYYNGAINNTTLLPKTYGLPQGIPFANRNSDATFASAGVLNKIEYPTGGSTSFIFEANQTLVTEPTQTNHTAEVTSLNQPGGTESSTTFSIEESQYVDVFYQVQLGNYPEESVAAQLIITNQRNEEIVHYYGSGNRNYSVYFPVGQYVMKMISPDNPSSLLHSELNYHTTLVETINKIVGGVRIKESKDFDPISNKSFIKTYEYPQSALLTGPNNDEDFLGNYIERATYDKETCDLGSTSTDPELLFKCSYHTRSSNSKFSFGNIAGGHIGYKTVKVKFGENGEMGSSESTFSYEGSPNAGAGFPYAPALVYESRNGLLLSQKDYTKTGQLIRELTNSYEFEERYRELGVKVGFLFDDPQSDSYGFGKYNDVITYDYYNMISERAKKTSTIIKEFDLHNNAIISEEKYYYDNPLHFQLTREEFTDSKGNLLRKEIKYPHDYPGISVYTEMVNRNIITPIEEKQTNISLNKELSINKTNFQLWQNNSMILPLSIESSKGGAATDVVLKINEYDINGNILEYVGKDEIINTILWGYNKQYPVAKIAGKKYSDVITQSGIDMTVLENPGNRGNLLTELAKLRTLSNCFMTTYTYKPLIGMASQTNVNNRTIYYEYDAFGRLKLVKDQEGKILKVNDYKYAQ